MMMHIEISAKEACFHIIRIKPNDLIQIIVNLTKNMYITNMRHIPYSLFGTLFVCVRFP